MKDFEELTKENADKVIPLVIIAQLAFNYNEKAVTQNAKFWVNDGYDGCCWYVFEPNFSKYNYKCKLGISRNFDISVYHKINDQPQSNVGMPAYNQLDIFKKLVEWGFVEL